MFSGHTTPEELKNAIIAGRFGFVFQELTRARKSHDYLNYIVFDKLRFRDGLVLDGRPNRRNNALEWILSSFETVEISFMVWVILDNTDHKSWSGSSQKETRAFTVLALAREFGVAILFMKKVSQTVGLHVDFI